MNAPRPATAQPANDPWTIGRLLNWTVKYLTDRKADSPRLDAEVLLAHAKKCKRIELYTSFDELASDELRQAFRELVRQRAEGKPVAYMVGRKEFYSLSFRVSPDVLIPRPETELLVIRLLDAAKAMASTSDSLKIADIGTGSGIIAICAAKHLPQAEITAVDISPAALNIAQQNGIDHKVDGQITWIESDLLASIPAEPKFHLIASNPPYIGSEEMPALAPEVLNYEPHLALEAGLSGTSVIERLIPEVAERLLPGGWFLLEIGYLQGEVVQSMLQNDGRFEHISLEKDLAGQPRLIQATRKA